MSQHAALMLPPGLHRQQLRCQPMRLALKPAPTPLRARRRQAARCSADGAADDATPLGSTQQPQQPPAENGPAAGGVRKTLRVRLEALRNAPLVAAVLRAGGRAKDTVSRRLPVASARAKLRALAKAADAAPEDAAKQDAYLVALAKHRCAPGCWS